MPRHNIVSDDTSPSNIIPTTLEGVAIHPLFASKAFRYVNAFKDYPLARLDQSKYDYPPLIVERMKPALRLASLLLTKALPHLHRIFDAPVIDLRVTGGVTEKCLDPKFQSSQSDIDKFDLHVLERMSAVYRFAVINSDDALQATHMQETARTYPHFEDVYLPQSAISTEWLWFLVRPDWDHMPAEEKYGKLFNFAVTLVHELAHGIWIWRVLSKPGVAISSVRELAQEPRFSPEVAWIPELGYVVEYQLFGGIPQLANAGTLSTVRTFAPEGHAYRVPFSLLNARGHVMKIHQLSRHSVAKYFSVRGNPLWNGSPQRHARGHRRMHTISLELLQDAAPIRRPLSTGLSYPLDPANAPILKVPDPRQLKPAITDANELVERDCDGNLPPREKSIFRAIKTRIREIVSGSGEWWKGTSISPAS
jgi:hypothetical protein